MTVLRFSCAACYYATTLKRNTTLKAQETKFPLPFRLKVYIYICFSCASFHGAFMFTLSQFTCITFILKQNFIIKKPRFTCFGPFIRFRWDVYFLLLPVIFKTLGVCLVKHSSAYGFNISCGADLTDLQNRLLLSFKYTS